MVTVKYEDLSLAFAFVSSGAPMEHRAYISLDTGRIYWVSALAPTEDELPDVFEAEQVDQALRAWCEANEIRIAPEPPSA